MCHNITAIVTADDKRFFWAITARNKSTRDIPQCLFGVRRWLRRRSCWTELFHLIRAEMALTGRSFAIYFDLAMSDIEIPGARSLPVLMFWLLTGASQQLWSDVCVRADLMDGRRLRRTEYYQSVEW